MSVNLLLQKADGMFPEGVGGRRAFARDGTAAELTNELLENASKAIEKLWNQRGYYPKKPADTHSCRVLLRLQGAGSLRTRRAGIARYGRQHVGRARAPGSCSRRAA